MRTLTPLIVVLQMTFAPAIGVGASLAAAQADYSITLSVLDVTNHSVTISYQSLPANRPNSYGNFIALWQGAAIPWTAPPLMQMTIPNETDSGSLVLDNITIAALPYVVTYGTGPDINRVAAMVPIAADSNAAQKGQSVALKLLNLTANSISVRYETLPGYQPASSGNWLGLWPGQMSPYNPFKPMACILVSQDGNSGVLGLNGLALGRGDSFTLVYFTGPPADHTDDIGKIGCTGLPIPPGRQTPIPLTTTAASMLVFSIE